MRRVPNDLLVSFRDRPGLVDALEGLGLSSATAEKIAEAFPDGRGLEDASLSSLKRLGATASQAQRVMSAFRVVRVCDDNCSIRVEGVTLTKPEDAVSLLRSAIGRKEQEYFAVILLDARQRVVDVLGVAVGSLSDVSVHPRELFREAIRRGAHSVIVAHNHPSASNEPSSADLELTHRMTEVGRLVGIPVLDHLIVTRDGFESLASMGQLV